MFYKRPTLVNTLESLSHINLVVIVLLAADSDAALRVVSVLLATHARCQFTRHHQLEQTIPVHIALAVKVVQVDATVPGAVPAVVADALGQRVVHAVPLHKELGAPGVEAVIRLGQGGNVGAVSPPKVPGVVSVLILHPTGVITLQKSAQTDGGELDVECIHLFTPAGPGHFLLGPKGVFIAAATLAVHVVDQRLLSLGSLVDAVVVQRVHCAVLARGQLWVGK
mmetsp:Transcript_37763/g.65262  ORF Transcript_37763/g.65262 Transcript_37763/m.65262 type:complete len:224 (-) Transcript_37763:560-1231(-)